MLISLSENAKKEAAWAFDQNGFFESSYCLTVFTILISSSNQGQFIGFVIWSDKFGNPASILGSDWRHTSPCR